MKQKALKLAAIGLLTLASLIITLPNNDNHVLGLPVPNWFPDINLSLGIDLQGGTQLRYQIDLSRVPAERISSVVSGVEEIIRRRVDGLGVSEPVIQTLDVGQQKHLIVELPGISDIATAKEAVGKVALLEFKEQQTEITEEEIAKAEEENVIREKSIKDILTSWNSTGSIDEAVSMDTKARVQKTDEYENTNDLSEETQKIISDLQNGQISELIQSEREYSIYKLLEKKVEAEKELDVSHILVAYQGSERAKSEVVRTKEEAEFRANKILERVKAGEDFAILAKEESDETTENGELPSPVKENGSPYHADFNKGAISLENIDDISELVESPFGYHIIKARDIRMVDVESVKYESIVMERMVPVSGGWKQAELTGEYFSYAAAEFQVNKPVVRVVFDEKGTELFAEITKRSVNQPVAIFLDSKIISAPTIQSEITDGVAIISGGSIDFRTATELADNLNAGAIPAPINLISQRTVGATLGQTALEKGMIAGAIGIIILFGFMILYL